MVCGILHLPVKEVEQAKQVHKQWNSSVRTDFFFGRAYAVPSRQVFSQGKRASCSQHKSLTPRLQRTRKTKEPSKMCEIRLFLFPKFPRVFRLGKVLGYWYTSHGKSWAWGQGTTNTVPILRSAIAVQMCADAMLFDIFDLWGKKLW